MLLLGVQGYGDGEFQGGVMHSWRTSFSYFLLIWASLDFPSVHKCISWERLWTTFFPYLRFLLSPSLLLFPSIPPSPLPFLKSPSCEFFGWKLFSLIAFLHFFYYCKNTWEYFKQREMEGSLLITTKYLFTVPYQCKFRFLKIA